MKHARLFPQANQRPQRLSTPLRPRVLRPPSDPFALHSFLISALSFALALQLRLANQLSRHARLVPTLNTAASNKSVSASRFPYSVTIRAFPDVRLSCHANTVASKGFPPRNTRSKSMATAPCANRGGSARLRPPPIHRAFSWCAFLDLIALCHWNLCNYQAGTRTALPKTVVTLASAYTSLSVSFERHSRAPVLLAPPPNISGKNSEPSPLLRTTSALPLRWPPHPDTSSHSPQR
ncbi:hypothetical protein B0H14DRAFT_2867188 [Mycena olivaceomarginata]|nr:hypothetical protein B0H14DRAFT_2867188 [Mycena olivaceomarginata]